ncbi:cytochrome P450 [Talaromyces proteolyticus]|uniref:Cytochrome P450 n=1 Tax=Talaromyces proteolyticus TaxID=1131652 RepID=A0AAD4PW42_9EURO|nr:cytochrome P450 [Talaromyces proteolyticus]KAH8692098.1 cytochrome P450 [Talaromyces proteolyticus]
MCLEYKIGPYHLLTSDLDVMSRMLGVRSRCRCAEWYTGMRFAPTRDNVESEKDEAKHSALRSKMAAGLLARQWYSGREVDRLEERVDGTDTSATAVRVVLLYLFTTPRVLEKFRAEFTEAQVSLPIRDSEANDLPYFQAIIKEALRIWPPVIGLMEKEVQPEGDVVNGQFIPSGANIGYSAFRIFRSKKLCVDDADEFHHERWIDTHQDS